MTPPLTLNASRRSDPFFLLALLALTCLPGHAVEAAQGSEPPAAQIGGAVQDEAPMSSFSGIPSSDINSRDGKRKVKVRRKVKRRRSVPGSNLKNNSKEDLGEAQQQEGELPVAEPQLKNQKNNFATKGKQSSPKRSTQSVGGGTDGECLRRIKREWKDAVELGIAYDWGKRKTINFKGRKTDDKYNYVRLGPMGKNLLQWHFSVQGSPSSVYAEGIYHGRILLPKNYPGSPPRVQMLTPSGRFVTGEDICLSASQYHPESWTPRWTVLSLVDALRLHMLTNPNEIGGVHASTEVRTKRALESRSWKRGVVDHSRFVEDGIFAIESKDGSSEEVMDSERAVEDRSEEVTTPSEEAIGMVTVEVRNRTERTAAVRPRSNLSKALFLIRVLIRSTLSVFTNPLKLLMVIFVLSFGYLNSSS